MNEQADEGHAAVYGSAVLADHDLVPVALDDRDLFHCAFSRLDEPISDASFAASYCWSVPLLLRRGVIEDHLCLFSAADGDLSMMLPPMSVGDPARLGSAIDACFEIMDRANAEGPGVERSRIEYVSDEMLTRIRESDARELSASPMPGDFVYSRDALVELAGGLLKGKRKLRSRFLRENADITTADLTPDDVPECVELLDVWRRAADRRHEGEANERLIGVDILRRRDETCTRRYLDIIDTLGLASMVVRVGGRLVGFTIAERLTPNMSVVCVEKTHPDFDGAPQFIYSEFCRTRLSDTPEINAGDDWGIASLRFTKQSYRPVRMLKKNVLTRQPELVLLAPAASTVRLLTHGRPASRRPLREPFPGVTVRPASIADARAIFGVENHAFEHGTDRFSIRQIRRLVANPRARVGVAEMEGRVVGWCVALIRTHVRWRSGRVYSVAVPSDLAGRGIGRALLNFSLDTLAREGIGRVYLEVRESNHAAIALYRSAGFAPLHRLASYYGQGHHGLRMRRITAPSTGERSPSTGGIRMSGPTAMNG